VTMATLSLNSLINACSFAHLKKPVVITDAGRTGDS
jgi:hypothetical protein